MNFKNEIMKALLTETCSPEPENAMQHNSSDDVGCETELNSKKKKSATLVVNI